MASYHAKMCTYSVYECVLCSNGIVRWVGTSQPIHLLLGDAESDKDTLGRLQVDISVIHFSIRIHTICCRIDLIRIRPATTAATATRSAPSPAGSPSLLPHVLKVREVLVVDSVFNPPLQFADGLPLHQDGTLHGRLVIPSGLGVARGGGGGGPGASCRAAAAAGTARRLGMEGGQRNANAMLEGRWRTWRRGSNVPSDTSSATNTDTSTAMNGRESARMRSSIAGKGPKCQCLVEPAGARQEEDRGRRGGATPALGGGDGRHFGAVSLALQSDVLATSRLRSTS